MEKEYSLAILTAEDEDGNREPIGIVTTRREADELAESDMERRQRLLNGGGDPGLCPYLYKIWSQGIDGYTVAEVWTA